MSELDLDRLERYRDEILKAEIGALLFNLGKTHIGFWKEKNGKVYFNVDDESFKNIFGFKLFSEYKKYYKKNEDLGKSPFEYELEKYGLKDFIFSKQIKFPFDIDGKSEIKWVSFFKGDALEDNEDGKEFIQKIFFRGCENINSGIDKGSPLDNKQLEPPFWRSNAFGSFKEEIKEHYFDKRRLCFYANLLSFLSSNGYFQNPNWQEIRNFILKEIKNWYSHLLSDSRFPINDVSLFDQAYMTASMFKAALAGLLLNTNESKEYKKNPQTIKWQILGIQYDKLALSEKALKPAHILWYRENAKNADDEVKKIIELEYALGNEIYRDESGIYFIVPEGIGDETLSNDLQEVKDKILNAFNNIFNDEIYPYIGLTKPSRGTMNLTFLLDKAKENFLKADYSKKSQVCVRGNAIGICQICRCRLVRDKKEEDETLMCDICKDRKKGRVERWLENQNGETIWIGELADKNNQVALVNLKFELIEWLNGDMLGSFITQKLSFPINENCNSYQELIISLSQDIKDNKRLNQTCIKEYHTNIPNIPLKTLIQNWVLERSIGDKWEKFIIDNLSDKSAIEFDNRKIHWYKLNDIDIRFFSKIILQFILRKNPSPARLRRIWESTSNFFKEVQQEILNTFTTERKKEEFLDFIKDFPEDKKSKVKNNIIFKQYFSIIDPTPISWQFVIPAEKIEEFVDKVQKQYYKNFKYVNGKLPLHIGIVVQNYKKPLYVGIKALRSIRRDIKSWQEIKEENYKFKNNYFEQIDNQIGFANIFEYKNYLTDYYSLYETDNFDYDFVLLPSHKGVKLCNDSDKFVVYPNTFDFEFLDTNTRRNDIFYQNAKRLNPLKNNRPYNWQEWQNFKNFRDFFDGKTALLHRVVSLIYSKMQDWENYEESFKKFMQSVFKKEEIDIERLGIKDYSFNEMKKFLDMFEFWHTALKEI